MGYLVLVRHSISHPQTNTAAHTWQLAAEGRQKCTLLADRLRHFDIRHIFTSDEPKAIETAQLLSDNLNISTEPIRYPGLRETARKTAPFFADRIQFQTAVQQAMAFPSELLYGEETFADALTRFSSTIEQITVKSAHQTTALVSHGTILSLYIAGRTGFDAFTIWKALDMPAYAVFRLPEMTLCEICFSLAEP